jgi:Lon protease (S16) C-terminal proteolytic domain./PDZ domain (Also known as DHR or GLGF).
LKKKRTIFLLSVLVILCAILWFPLPYYVSSPGMAKALDDVVAVEGGAKGSGEFLLTTVSMARGNLLTLIKAKLDPYSDVEPLDEVRDEDETDEEYRVKQLYLMENSQENALQVAFEKAGKSVEVDYNGIYVLNVLEGGPSDGTLAAGDRIVAVDGKDFRSAEEFTSYIQNKPEGTVVTLSIVRNGKEMNRKITLGRIKATGKTGIGITLAEDKEVSTEPKVEFHTEEIGGPSAGFMFSLEIYEQLVKKDITKGYRIAGTGTIAADGSVGPIGGVEKKVIAADRAGADIFLAPSGRDYELAVQTAKAIGSGMEIVSVSNFDEGLRYLDSLRPKK